MLDFAAWLWMRPDRECGADGGLAPGRVDELAGFDVLDITIPIPVTVKTE